MTVDVLPPLGEARVLVIGDVMLDRYWHGQTSRISPEAPVPVVHIGQCEERPGGAANVALNVAALGAQVWLLGVTGDDSAADVLSTQLTAAGVHAWLERVPGRATITKLRVLSRHQQLIRLDFEDAPSLAPASEAFLAQYQRRLSEATVVVLSDYAKGTLGNAPTLIRLARAAGRPVVVDPKGHDFERYRGATLVTPNLAEFEAVVGSCPDEATLARRGAELASALELDALLVTRGEHGMTLLRPAHTPLHLPTQAREVYDVTGAGDTVVSVLATALAAAASLETAMRLANVAAGLVVGKLGTATVSAAELRAALRHPEHDEGPITHGIVDEDGALRCVAAAHARGERVVMTNGCFDLLHAGHLAYLREARRLGDRLLVAVNDDASVRTLKGTDRPIHALEHRMAVLAGLRDVDWVVPFTESTPERLICRVLPDVLVKGGDYTPDTIAGAECVRARGGQVVVVQYLPGHSSSAVIARIRGFAAG